MNLFRKKTSDKYSVQCAPTVSGFSISLHAPNGAAIPLSLEALIPLVGKLDPVVSNSLATCLQNAGRFNFNADSEELSEDIHEAFSPTEIATPLIELTSGVLHISYLCVAAARTGNLAEIANISQETLNALSVPEYAPLKAKLRAHNGVESPSFGLDLEVMDLNGTPKSLKRSQGHMYLDEDSNPNFVSPYFNRLISRHAEHVEVRKTDKYKSDSQHRFCEMADLRSAALSAEIRIDPFVKAQNIVFIKTLPYIIGRGPDDTVHLNPVLPETHSKQDRGFQIALTEATQEGKPDLINIHDAENGTTRVVLSPEAWEDVKRIRSLQRQGQAVLEEVIENPVKFFGRKPRSPLAQTFSDRVSGFIIGKLTSNRADSNSGNDWGSGYEGNSTLLRSTDGSTIPLTYTPTPPEYAALKIACSQLEEEFAKEEASLRVESGAQLTQVPIQKNKKIYIPELKGEFNFTELTTCCSRIEYSNRVELEPEEEALARETIEFAESKNRLTVEWGKQDDGSARTVPVSSLKASLPQPVGQSAEDRVSLAIEDQSTRLGQPPSWHFSNCDLGRFASPPHFRNTYSLEEHQRRGFAWLTWIFEHVIDKERYPHRGALLADDMGVGKTVQLLSFVAWLRAKPEFRDKPVLVVAPVSLIQTSWMDDGFKKFFEDASVDGFADGALGPIYRFSDCPIKIDRALLLSEAIRVNEELADPNKRLADCEIDEGIKVQLQSIESWARGKIIMTSYETLRLNSLAFGSIDFAAAILDEAQKIKNVGVLQSNAAKALKADMCIAMTGTPIENSLMDLWSIMDFVLPGHLGTAESFRERFVNPVKRTTPESTERTQLREALERALSPVWFRRTKKEVFKGKKTLPLITHYDEISDANGDRTNAHEVQMSDQQFAVYETQLAYFKNAKPGHRLPVIRSMIEACSAPWLATDLPLRWENREALFNLSPKLRVTMEILESIRKRPDSEGRKVIIFANVIQIQLGLAFFIFEWNKLTGGDPMEVEVYNGEASQTSRAEMLKRFKSAPGFQVLVISPKAGGAGLNIVEANNVIHYTREWNPALERQATDRVYRMGQQRPVHVFYPTTSLRSRNMISAEENLANRLSAKRDIMDDFTVSASDHNINEAELGAFTAKDDGRDKRITAAGLHLLDPYSFECLVACLYDKLGYEAHWCGKSGDGGADVLALNSTSAILIQVKHTQKSSIVGTTAIREIRGAKSHYESKIKRQVKLMAATNFKFSERAVQLTREGEPVDLMEFSTFKELLDKHSVTGHDVEQKKLKGKYKL